MRYLVFLAIVGPFILWSCYFLLLYGVQAVGCRAGWDTVAFGGLPFLRSLIVFLFALASVASAVIYMAVKRAEHCEGGILRIARYSALAALVSTLLVFPGIFWLQLC